MIGRKLKNITLVLGAIIFAATISIAVAMFGQHEISKAEATPNNTRNLEVAIVWSDNVEAHFGQSSSVTLYQNGAPVSTVTLSSPLWWYQWTGLDAASTYDVRQISYFDGYYTEYAWDAQNRMTIKNIRNGSPVPPWPTPTPEPYWDPGENITIDLGGGEATPSNNPAATTTPNTEEQKPNSNSNNAVIHNNPNNTSDESAEESSSFFDDLMQNINKSWLVILGIVALFAIFIFEKISSRKRK